MKKKLMWIIVILMLFFLFNEAKGERRFEVTWCKKGQTVMDIDCGHIRVFTDARTAYEFLSKQRVDSINKKRITNLKMLDLRTEDELKEDRENGSFY